MADCVKEVVKGLQQQLKVKDLSAFEEDIKNALRIYQLVNKFDGIKGKATIAREQIAATIDKLSVDAKELKDKYMTSTKSGNIDVTRKGMFGNPFYMKTVRASGAGVLSAMYYDWLASGKVPEGYTGDRDLLAEKRNKILSNISVIQNVMSGKVDKKLFYDGAAKEKDLSHVIALMYFAREVAEGKVKTNKSTVARKEFDKLPGKSSTKTMTFAGVGSRNTPPDMLKEMARVANKLEGLGYTLNTGLTFGKQAEGADKAFADGFTDKSKVNLFTPEIHGKRPREQAVAKEIHETPEKLTEGSLKLQARNTSQVFGDKLDTPVDFVLAWTPLNNNGEVVTHADQRYYGGKDSNNNTGGTGQAIALASLKGMPVINMADPKWEEQLDKLLAEKPDVGTTPATNNKLTNENVEVVDKFDRATVQANPNKIYVFGDNTDSRVNKRKSLKDAAGSNVAPTTTQAQIRGLDNAFGIDTKKSYNGERVPADTDFFSDADYGRYVKYIDKVIAKLKAKQAEGKVIVLPKDGIGTGKAALQDKAPKLYKHLAESLNELAGYEYMPIGGTKATTKVDNGKIHTDTTNVNDVIQNSPKLQKMLKTYGLKGSKAETNFQYDSAMQKIKDNKALTNVIKERLAAQYPNVTATEVDELVDADGNPVLGRAIGAAIEYSKNASIDTIPHEYAHVYVSILKNTPLVKNLIKSIASIKGISLKDAEEYLVDTMGKKYVKKLSDGVISRGIDKLWNMIKDFFSDSKIEAMNSNINLLADRFYNGVNADAISLTPKVGYSLVSTEKTFSSQPFAASVLKDIMSTVGKGKALFTGSAALALQGTVYRKGKDGITDLHDLDIIVDSAETREKLKKHIEKNYNTTVFYDFNVTHDSSTSHITTLAVLDKEHKVDSKSIVRGASNRVVKYNIIDTNNKVVGTYTATLNKNTGEIEGESTTGAKAVLVDLLQDRSPEKNYNMYNSPELGVNIALAASEHIFTAKFNILTVKGTNRDKDIIDAVLFKENIDKATTKPEDGTIVYIGKTNLYDLKSLQEGICK